MWWSVALGMAMAVTAPADALTAAQSVNQAADLQGEPRRGASAIGVPGEARLVRGMTEATPKTKAHGRIRETKKPISASDSEFCDSFKQR